MADNGLAPRRSGQGNRVAQTTYGSIPQDRVEISEEFLRSGGRSEASVNVDIFGGKRQKVDVRAYAFILFVCLETAFVLCYCVWRARDDLPLTELTRPDFIYTSVVMINSVFGLYYAVHGVLRERVLELYMFIAASLLLTAYVAYEFLAYKRSHPPTPADWTTRLPLIRFVVDCLCEPINIFASLYVARLFGWADFRTVGADAEIGRLYHTLCVFHAFVTINIQVHISHICLSFLSQASAFRFEWVIELVAMTSGLAALGIARYMFKREKRMFGLWAATACVQPAYVIWKLAEFTIIFPGTYKAGVKVPALFLGAISIVTFSFMFVWGCLAYRNFGKGLYEKINRV